MASRHRIGESLPEVAHSDIDPIVVAVCREVLKDTGAECVIMHGSPGWDEQTDINIIVVHEGASEKRGADWLASSAIRIKNRFY